MKDISLQASDWKTRDDFYDSLFNALGSPSWHGRNFNALRDSIAGGQINEVDPPFILHLSGLGQAPSELKPLVQDFVDLVKGLRAQGNDVDILTED